MLNIVEVKSISSAMKPSFPQLSLDPLFLMIGLPINQYFINASLFWASTVCGLFL